MTTPYIYTPSRRRTGRPVLHTIGWGLFAGLIGIIVLAQLGFTISI